MSERGGSDRDPRSAGARLRRYLTSRKNLVGMSGAAVGLALNLTDVIGDIWPAVSVGLYAIGALITPPEPLPPLPLTLALHEDADQLTDRIRRESRRLPDGAAGAMRGILAVARTIIERLDKDAENQADLAALPQRLADIEIIVRTDLPACLDAYLARAPTPAAAAELATQLDLVAGAADRLADAVPDMDVQRAEDLTQDLRRRYPE